MDIFKLNKDSLDYAISVSKQIQPTTSNLKAHGITTFSYLKFFNDGRYSIACSNPEWSQFHIMNIIGNGPFSSALANVNNDCFHVYLWPREARGFLLESLQSFRIWNGISFYKKREQYVECWAFASDNFNENIINMYINNTEFLKKFILFFNSQHLEILNNRRKETLSYFSQDIKSIEGNNSLRELDFSKYSLLNKEGYLTLTKKEMGCLSLLAHGKSMKEIALISGVSPRTIESQMNNIKLKSNLQYKNQLIELYYNNL